MLRQRDVDDLSDQIEHPGLGLGSGPSHVGLMPELAHPSSRYTGVKRAQV